MKKFKVGVTKVFHKEVYVYADDQEHAEEIGSEIEMLMDCDDETFTEADWSAKEVDNFDEGLEIYEPEQEYLK